MPFVNAPGIVEMAPIWEVDGQPCENTFYYKVTGTIDIAKLTAIANSYITWAAAHVDQWATNCRLLKVYMRDLTTQHSATVDIIPTSSVVGTKTGNALPNNVTFALKRMTGLAGRANRGRIYHLSVVEDDRDGDNQYTPARATSLVTNLNTLLAAQNTANSAQEVVFHRNLGTGTTVIGYTFTDLDLDSQRRRLPGHNRHR